MPPAIDFPASPTTGQTYAPTGTGVVYTFNGTVWLASGASAGGDFCANQTSSFGTLDATTRVLVLTQVVSGNSGTWYSTSTGRYTPPAGRYQIVGSYSATCGSGTRHLRLYLRKNGVDIHVTLQTTVSAGSYAEPVISMIVDANGTDYFDLATSSSAGACTPQVETFLAYPISGIKGPVGDAGTALAQNAQTGNYTLVLGDANGHIYHAVGAGAGDTYTIPANASVAYPIGTTLTFVNDDATNAVTIAITTDTLVLSPGTTTGSRTLATGGIATALKVTSTRWIINGSGLS